MRDRPAHDVSLHHSRRLLSWLLSTIGAGGGEFILIVAASYWLGAQAVAPVVTVSNLVAVPSRTLLFREHIDWGIVRWFAAGAVPGVRQIVVWLKREAPETDESVRVPVVRVRVVLVRVCHRIVVMAVAVARTRRHRFVMLMLMMLVVHV